MGLKYRPERSWKVGGWTVMFNIDSIPAPALHWFWYEHYTGFFDLTLDSGGDPILALVSPTFAPPWWLMPLVEVFDR